MRPIFYFAACLFLTACALERPAKLVPNNRLRLPRTAFQGKQFYFLNSVVEVSSPGETHAWIPPGLYLDSDHIVQFDIQEHTLEVRSVYAKVRATHPAPETTVLARIPIRNVDVVWKQNLDREDTRDQEVTEDRNEWRHRQYIEIDAQQRELDPVSLLAKDCKSVTPPEQLEYRADTGGILFDLVRLLSDDTQVRVRYSFLPVESDNGYQPKAYSLDLESRFGFFKTNPAHAEQFDRYGRVTVSDQDKHQKLNRWDPRKTVTYYLGPDFPAHLEAEAFASVKAWNAPLEKVLGHPLIRLEKNSGQRLGDIHFNLLHYDRSKFGVHGVLGYGPTVTHPVTGEIRQGTVVIYGPTIGRALFNERIWSAELPPEVKETFDESDEMVHHIPDDPIAIAAATLDPIHGIPNQWGTARPLEALEKFISTNHPVTWAQQLRDHFRQTRLTHSTYLDSNVLVGVRDLYSASRGSEEAVEKKMVANLINHELGHELGLRHNLKASADRRPIDPLAEKKVYRSVSAMDYTYLITDEPPTPGEYDVAALSVGYSSQPGTEGRALGKNFYYCTDEGLYSSLDPLCSPHDRGTTLVETLRGHYERYYSAYAFNNLRLDRVHFTGNESDYLRRIVMLLLPLRQIHDHADAIVRAYQKSNYADLWYLARERIYKDKSTTSTAWVEVSEGERLGFQENKFVHGYEKVKLEIDLLKVETLIDDAREARSMAIKAFTDIILNSKRPNYEGMDERHRRVQVRGVLEDKLVSLLLIGLLTPDPLGKGKTISLFQTLEEEGSVQLFRSLISNVLPLKKLKTDIRSSVIAGIDVNLRNLAVMLITKHLGQTGGVAEAKDLLRFERVYANTQLVYDWSQESEEEQRKLEKDADKETKGVMKELAFRMVIRDRYQDLMRAVADGKQVAQTNAENEIRRMEAERAEHNVTYSQIYVDQYYRGKINDARMRYPSAVGPLLRDNLNRLEDRWLTALDTAQTSKLEDDDPSRTAKFYEISNELHRAYVNEKVFVEDLFKTLNYK